MNKEEKRLLQEQSNAMKAIASRLERLDSPENQIPVLFNAECKHCKEITSHVSHIARKIPGDLLIPFTHSGFMASTATMLSAPPIKTCLSCGITTYMEYEDENSVVK